MDQIQFVLAHYATYSNEPHTILDWLINEANRIAYEEEQERQLKDFLYEGPRRPNNNYNENDDEEENYEEDTTFGVNKTKKKKINTNLLGTKSS